MSTTPPEALRLPVPGTPAGTDAWLAGPASTSLRDRRGNLKARTVDLRATDPQPADLPVLERLTDADITWLLSAASRTAQAWDRRFGAGALPLVHRLAIAGVLDARHHLTPNLSLGPLHKTFLTDAWQRLAHDRQQARRGQVSGLRDTARALANTLTAQQQEPGLQQWLGTVTGAEPRLRDVLVATQDLLDGREHDGPRAFSQHHFGDTKTNDDIAGVLTAAGASSAMLQRLGVVRAQYVGLAGPVIASAGDSTLNLATLRGPVLLRTDQPLHLSLGAAHAIVVVENLQAAETVATQMPDIAVIHTNGQPGDPLLAAIRPLLQQTRTPIHVVCDADLGGCRIALRVLTVAPHAHLHDIGAYPHAPGRAFAQTSLDGLAALTDGPVGPLASRFLQRGYVVEQEVATRAAVREVLL